MKILFDQNISFRIVKRMKDIFPGCTQVRLEGLENTTDTNIHEFAKKNGYSIITFDADFYDLVTLKGHPPKVIWLRIGNTSTIGLENVLRENAEVIKEFITSAKRARIGCLEIK